MKLLQKYNGLLPITKKLLWVGVILLILWITTIFVAYQLIKNAKAAAEINSNKDKIENLQTTVDASKNQINEDAQTYLQEQRKEVKNANEIAKKYENFKPIKYEKPVIRDASLEAMRDSLDIAEPD